ncbi:MAG: serine hydrolase [Proteobacteria bacterium]|nr:serine hydrolase [Pseudomonadota bacterium]
MNTARMGLIAAAIVVVAGTGAVAFERLRPDLALRVATAVVAHNMCDKVFVSGLDPQTSFDEVTARDGIRLLRPLLRFSVDRAHSEIDASLVGAVPSRAAFYVAQGCVLHHSGSSPYILRSDIDALRKPLTPPLLGEIAGTEIVAPADPRLVSALDHAFEEKPGAPLRRTKAVVAVKDHAIVAERYADGIAIDTPLPGYSLTKSVVNALLGIMTRKGLATPSFPAAIAEWHGHGDQRSTIDVEHLMRMTSGLALDETSSGFDPSSRMVYLHNDIAAFAVQAPLIAPPGTRWAYSSPSTQILAKIIRDATGGPERSLRFAWRELFNPLGMTTVTLEFDGAGTLQGSSYMSASARDWARFGLLYLNDGRLGGTRILPDEWVGFSASATPGTDYGAGFWTLRGHGPMSDFLAAKGVPRNAFLASGNLGQRIVILPTQQLVIVRLGDAADPTGDIAGLAQLVTDMISATRSQ